MIGLMRRMLRVIVVFLILGALVNVGVAWGFAARMDRLQIGDRGTELEGESLAAAMERFWPDTHATHFLVGFRSQYFGLEASFLSAGSGLGWFATEVRVGSPMRVFDGHSESTIPPNSEVLVNLIRVDLPWIGSRLIPYGPLWMGLIVNTLFYSGVLWLVFLASFQARRHFRGRKGLCPACAYPVGSSDVCTECGEAVTPQA